MRRSRGRSGCALPPPRPTLGSSRPAPCPAGTRCGSSMSSWPAPPWATCVTCVPARWWCPPPQPQASPPLWPQAPVHHWWWERQGWTPEHEDDGDLLGGEVVHLQGLWGKVADYSHFSATNLREEEREVFSKTTRIAKVVQYHSLAVLPLINNMIWVSQYFHDLSQKYEEASEVPLFCTQNYWKWPRRPLFVANYPQNWWNRLLFHMNIIFRQVLGKFWRSRILGSFLALNQKPMVPSLKLRV